MTAFGGSARGTLGAVRNWFFTLSLRSGIGLGVSRTAAGALQEVTRCARGMLREILRVVLPVLKMIQSRQLDTPK
jgi:hypothetical protein